MEARAGDFSNEVSAAAQEIDDPDHFQRLSKASRLFVERIDRRMLGEVLADSHRTRPAAALLLSSPLSPTLETYGYHLFLIPSL